MNTTKKKLNDSMHVWQQERSNDEYIGHRTQLNTKKVNFLVFQKFYLNFALFLSKFIKTYILLNFIHDYKKFFRRNRTFKHYA